MSEESFAGNNKAPLVSIVIPILNVGKMIASCLDSILEQTYGGFEVICVDGGSRDKSAEIAFEYSKRDPRIAVYRASCQSAGAARNIGMKKATGKYLAFIDSDDYVDQDMLKTLVDEAETYCADVVCFPCLRYDDIKESLLNGTFYLDRSRIPNQEVFSKYEIANCLFQFISPYTFSRLYNVEFLRKNGMQLKEYPVFDDVYFSYICLEKANRIRCIRTPLYYHRKRINSKSQNSFKHVLFFCQSIEDIRQELIKDGCFDLLQDSLCEYAIRVLVELISSCPESTYRMRALESLESEKASFLVEYLNKETERKQPLKGRVDTLLGALEQHAENQRLQSENIVELLVQQKLSEAPLVSIIMPVYQDEEYLQQALDSIFSQGFDSFELICIDDGSTDRSLQLLLENAKTNEHMSVLTQSHRGVSLARNVGIEHAVGEYIYFMDSDDILKTNALETMFAAAQKNDLEVLCFNGERYYDPDCTEHEHLFRPEYERREVYPELTDGKTLLTELIENRDYTVVVWLVLFKRKLLTDNGICFYPGIIHSDNLFSITTLLRAKRAGFIPDNLYLRRIHPNSIMTMPTQFASSYAYYVLGVETLKLSLDKDIRSSPRVNACVLNRANAMFNTARNDYNKLTDLEKGKLYALPDNTRFFSTVIVDYSNLTAGKTKAEKELKSANEQLTEVNKKLKSANEQLTEVNKKLKTISEQRDKANQELNRIKGSRLYRWMLRIRRVLRFFKR